jgi:crotonobetainyl-CoA:carnitine CoA-transferase CaiB-like acyl-CoA transferase
MDDMFVDPQVKHLGVVSPIETGDSRGTIKVLSQPFTLSRTPSKMVLPPPERGQHSDAILKDFGFSKKEITALKKKGVI